MRPAVVTARKVSSSCLLLLLCLLSFIIRASPLDRRIPDVGRRHRQSKERKTSGKGLLVAAQYPGQEPAEIARLLDAFGLKTVPRPNRTAIAAPPAFMLNLYHQLESTGSSSSLRQPAASPRANTVRSFNEKGTISSRNKYLFDTRSVLDRETVLAAELHLYKQKPRYPDGHTDDIPQQVTCEIYKLSKHGHPTMTRTLVDRKMVNSSYSGWVQFSVTSAFENGDVEAQHILSDKLFEIRIKSEPELPKGTIAFAKRPRPKHKDHRPLLVLFLDDKNVLASDITLPGTSVPTAGSQLLSGMDKKVPSNGGKEGGLTLGKSPQATGAEHSNRRRKRRASSRMTNRGRTKCQLYDYYVDFHNIGWSDWVIAPNGYWANFCEGNCPFPLDPNFNATNHATVQAILHMQTGSSRNNRRLPNPCCVPATLESIHVLYLDDLNNVVLKEFNGMIATSCGCH
ncbi:bone morphogenetic protein 2-A-like [Asterias amurensis]|uniref:bone morphogenetic protein 2-A-like n=1 Tax=Asterias amurensis TaxID=7602 RepID=UPI003AB38929